MGPILFRPLLTRVVWGGSVHAVTETPHSVHSLIPGFVAEVRRGSWGGGSRLQCSFRRGISKHHDRGGGSTNDQQELENAPQTHLWGLFYFKCT
eukprot:COSAG01_NODE_623_length_14742_cov_22.391177_13_plen_94_part_00